MKMKVESLLGWVALLMSGLMMNGCMPSEEVHVEVTPTITVKVNGRNVPDGGVVILDRETSDMEVKISLQSNWGNIYGKVILYVNGQDYGEEDISGKKDVVYSVSIEPGETSILVEFYPPDKRVVKTEPFMKKKVYIFEDVYESSFTLYPVYLVDVGVQQNVLRCGESYQIKYTALGYYDSLKILPPSIDVPGDYTGILHKTVIFRVYVDDYSAIKQFDLSYDVACRPEYTIKWIGLENEKLRAVQPGKKYEVKYSIYGSYDSVKVDPRFVTVPEWYSEDTFRVKVKFTIYKGRKDTTEYRILEYVVGEETTEITCPFSIDAVQYSFIDESGKRVELVAPTYVESASRYHVSVMPGVPFRLKLAGKPGWVIRRRDFDYKRGVVTPETLRVTFYKSGNSETSCEATIYIDPISAIDLDYILYTHNIRSFRVCASGEEIPFTAVRYVFINLGNYGKYEVESGGMLKTKIDGCISVKLEKWR